jgi:hypothetical protein
LEDNVGTIKLLLFDLSGKKQKELFFTDIYSGDNFLSVNTSGLGKGLYLLKISSKQFVLKKKLVKN